RSSALTCRPSADLGPHPSRTTELDQRTSRLHAHHRPVKPPENRHKSQKLRAEGSRLSATAAAPGRCLLPGTEGPVFLAGRRAPVSGSRAPAEAAGCPTRAPSTWSRRTPTPPPP